MNSGKIKLLPPFLANQIAAGEVIERPASVVKELLENAADAGAGKIQVVIKQGGFHQIKITDDGCGIAKEDLPLAVCAHATSKIGCVDDLFSIRSLGFRGEALASIAAVSKCSLASKTVHAAMAHQLVCSGNQILDPGKPCAHPNGTTVEVNDLFFNTPVRRQFLKSPRSEMLAIEKVIKNFALSSPHIAIMLVADDKVLLNLPALERGTSAFSRVAKIMGKAFVDASLELTTEHAGMKLTGWVSTLEFMRSQNDKQYFYLNQRMIRDKLINHAIKQAYEGLLYPGRHPAYVLYLSIAPQEVDVNVHPTKHEVRFKQARLVHDFLASQLDKALLASAPPQEVPHRTESKRAEYQSKLASEHRSNVQRSHLWQEVIKSEGEREWVMIEPDYALIFLGQQCVLCDVTVLLRRIYRQMLNREEVVSRPILVPIRLHPNAIQLEVVTHHQTLLDELGIKIDLLDEDILAVRTIASVLNQLDFEQWLNSINDKTCINWSREQIIESLVNANAIYIDCLDEQERVLIVQCLQEELNLASHKPRLYKPFTAAEAAKVLNG